jgi:fumarate hydratase class II
VMCEMLMMASAQVAGNDAAITISNSHGNFELNVMLPVIANNLLQSISILGNASRLFADKAVAGFTVNRDRIAASLDRNPILVTALNSIIGYDKAAEIAKKAYKEGRPIRDVAAEMTDLPKAELARLLDPKKLTEGGIEEKDQKT